MIKLIINIIKSASFLLAGKKHENQLQAIPVTESRNNNCLVNAAYRKRKKL